MTARLATATTCPEDQATPTCPEDQATSTATTCPEDQAPTTCPEGPAALPALARLAAALTRPSAPGARRSWVPECLRPGSPGEAVLRTTALIVWAALAGACQADAADPVRTAQAFVHAVQSRDMKAVLPLIEQSAAARLTSAAEQATDQVGGRRQIKPAEMLQIVDVPPTFELAETVLVDNDGAVAHVRLVGAQQQSFPLTLVHEDGAWHVRIPTPTDDPQP
ncbi:MAG: hypothetical protein JNL82_22420 [Myxococcales bacterium]|nr:hypothetical protein [Myxococcales bacterium]